jgi:hypothetical protein
VALVALEAVAVVAALVQTLTLEHKQAQVAQAALGVVLSITKEKK